MPSVTLEELGVTKEEYALAQERIQNGNIADLRCDNMALYNFLGDMNGNGILTGFDIVLARRVLLGVDPITFQSILFGLISEFHIDSTASNTDLSNMDLILATRVILGLPC